MIEDKFLGYCDNSSTVINSKSDSSTHVYKNCNIKNCIFAANSSIGDFSRIYDSSFGENAQIERFNLIKNSSIGRFSYTGKNTVIQNSNIGNFCSISWNVTIGAGEHDYSKLTTHAFLYDNSFQLKPKDFTPYNLWDGNCTLKNDVWIGANACIGRNVTIGNGAIVGAGAVVTNDVKPYSIVAGVPARVIKMRFDEKTISLIEGLKWWKLPAEIIKKNYDLFNNYPLSDVIEKIESLCKSYL